MIFSTVTGRLTKDAVTRQTQKGDSVTGFSVASDFGFGENKRTDFVNCSLWGKRGEALAPYLLKGQQVTVIGESTQEEYEGKQSLKVPRVTEIILQGDSSKQKPKPDTDRVSESKVNNDPFDDDCPF